MENLIFFDVKKNQKTYTLIKILNLSNQFIKEV